MYITAEKMERLMSYVVSLFIGKMEMNKNKMGKLQVFKYSGKDGKWVAYICPQGSGDFLMNRL